MKSLQQTLRVLVVHDNPYTAGTLVSFIRKELPAESLVRHATDIRGATDLMNQERYHAVMVSQDLPDGKGVTLLKSLLVLPRRPYGLFLIHDSASHDIDIVRFVKEHPQVTLVQVPFRYPVVAALVRNALLPPQSTEQSYYGLRLSELIQAFSLGRRSSTIQLIMPDNKVAAIYIEKGQLIHVVYGDEEGKEALRKIILSKKGVIRVEKDCPTAKHSIDEPTQHVLLDIYRQMDEAEADDALPADLDLVDPGDDLEDFFDEAFDVRPQP